MMARMKYSLKDAHQHVKKRRPIIGPHHSLQEQLLDFEKHLTGTSTMTLADFYAKNRYSPYDY